MPARPPGKPPRNYCACVRNTVLIALAVAFIVGMLVILPLKVIFSGVRGADGSEGGGGDGNDTLADLI